MRRKVLVNELYTIYCTAGTQYHAERKSDGMVFNGAEAKRLYDTAIEEGDYTWKAGN